MADSTETTDPEAKKLLPDWRIHPLRDSVLGEMHSRPFHALTTPARLLHFAFTHDVTQAIADRRAFVDFCLRHGVVAPDAATKHHYVELQDVAVRWEQHGEFTTFTYIVEGLQAASLEAAKALTAPLIAELPQTGPLLVSVALSLEQDDGPVDLERLFDETSVVASNMSREGALTATDFRLKLDGFVHILVRNKSLSLNRTGALTQRLLEIETYRTLALLGLPEALRCGGQIRKVEAGLNRILGELNSADGGAADHKMLEELTLLAAELEADLAASSYRFGASRAYDSLVQQRLVAVGEQSWQDYSTFESFLARRMAPAMRTCQVTADRQSDLSQKLSRAANLLRTRVDVAIERQNRDLLQSMNDRTRLQLRLQQTVEGLSVAAISYYVVSLLGYVFKGVKELGYGPDPSFSMAIAAPFVVLGVALIVRRIRRSHTDH